MPEDRSGPGFGAIVQRLHEATAPMAPAGPAQMQHLLGAQGCVLREARVFWSESAARWQALVREGTEAGTRAAGKALSDPAGAICEITSWQTRAWQQGVQDMQDYADLCVRCGAHVLSGEIAAEKAGLWPGPVSPPRRAGARAQRAKGTEAAAPPDHAPHGGHATPV